MNAEIGKTGKKYGLILKKKPSSSATVKSVNNPFLQNRLAAFQDDSDEEEGKNKVESAIKKESSKSLFKKQTQLQIEKALSEDPSVYEYDNVYDDMKSQKQKNDPKLKEKKAERKPKYITGLLKMAESRKKEDERRLERKIQKERDAEGNEFADKEEFVTSAYKKKLEDMKEAEAKEKREAEMEAMLDVTKQKDLSGFYRNLYKQTTGDVNIKEEPDATVSVKTEVTEEDQGPVKSGSEEKLNRSKVKNEESTRRRNYRSHHDSGSSSDGERVSSTRKKLGHDRESHRRHDSSRRHSPDRRSRKSRDRDSGSMKKRSRERHLDKPSHGRHHRDNDSNRTNINQEHQRNKDNSDELEPDTIEPILKSAETDINPDRDDSDSADETENVVEIKPQPEPVKEKTHAEKYARRNNDSTISDAKARYLARKAATSHVSVTAPDSD
ncbi:uncharacterized protein LOC141900611 [Tubulanus polymorphus]|uniref:uncharacterized protein LOC141900611 n=1 Tax=Tubulanus polymorphus TaxID=672921 RepID=UPI003DA2843A